MKVVIKSKGNFKNTELFFNNSKNLRLASKLNNYGLVGAAALASMTPLESGKTASSWDYEIHGDRDGLELVWTNSNVNKGYNIAILIQYGHGTGTGGYVQGRDYINPAIRPVFDAIANDIWKEVTK